MNRPPSFDVCGPLPQGTTVLEASAGTGKTFTIAALATRYVAEGHARLHELMLVTFGRAATQELRERVRERLVDTECALGDPAGARASGDDLVRMLARPDDAEVEVRRKRLTTALADFDAATIATTHGFCQQMLTGLGVDGDLEPGSVFVESIDDLVTEVVHDLYVRKWGRPGAEEPELDPRDAARLVREAVRDRHARLVPDDAEPGSAAAARHGLAAAARSEVERRKRQRRLRDYDDLLTQLRAAMTDPDRGAAACQRVRRRYRIVMVDEFQDTDPVQWEILRLAFHGHTTLVLIGDPKQAIYAFRGGDVVTYLTADEAAGEHATLARNWRSDADLLSALATVFGQAALGHERIAVRPVQAHWSGRRLHEAPAAPVRIRWATRARLGVGPTQLPKIDVPRALVATDVAGDVVRLLGSGACLSLDAERGLEPGDVAVLVHTNKQAVLVHEALSARGVPAVLTGAVNVFATPMATAWLELLQALEQPHAATRVRTAALGLFVGWDASRLAAAGDDAMDELGPQMRGWAEVLGRRGVPALVEAVTEATDLTARLLAAADGERMLTDLRHIAESLHTAVVQEQLGASALVELLQRRIRDARADADAAEERSRRLESDADAVQVVTVHRSKGLQFPVVYVPFGWDRWSGTPDVVRFHTEEGERSLDVGGPDGPGFEEHRARYVRESLGEDLRVLYVALTRAQCQVVTWWMPSNNTRTSALQRLLFDDVEPGQEPAAKVAVGSDDQVRARLARLSERTAGCIGVEEIGQIDDDERWQPAPAAPVALQAATFDRRLDATWRRTSYSALTAAAHDAAYQEPGVGSEPEAAGLDDEPERPPPTDAPPATGDALDSPMAHLPGGTALGLVVHAVLEEVDTGATDLAAELVERSEHVLARRLDGPGSATQLAHALLPVLRTPLGPLAGGRTLGDVRPADRLAELGFELPVAGGDDPVRAAVTLPAIADLLRDRLAPQDRFAGYPDRLAGLDPSLLRGYLVGSIDAVLRVGDREPAYLVVDYKTNWLGAAPSGSGRLTTDDYRPPALVEEMLAAHYPLQLLLYLVALHRFLRWRQPGYDPDVHLGGGLYLFVRGMAGPATPVLDASPCGVLGWAPPSGLVAALSDLLAGS